MILSNLITANSLDENPASHAKAKTVKTIKLLAPEGFKRGDLLYIAGTEPPVVAIIYLQQWSLLPRTVW